MMKKLFLLTLTVLTFGFASAQEMTIEEMKAQQAELSAKISESQAVVDASQAELDALQVKINRLSGWLTGLTGVIGLNFGASDQWFGTPNPTASSNSISIGVTAFANKDREKFFWNNKLILNKAWQRVDVTEADEARPGNLFDFGTVDLLNFSSLYGYKLTPKIAVSALLELNTSIEQFLEPGTLDFGVGITWTPYSKLVVVIHPLNYHIAWSADGDTDSQGAVGAKIRADWNDSFLIAGRKIAWSSTFTTFLPYTGDDNPVPDFDKFGLPVLDAAGDQAMRMAGLFEWTWLNTFSFNIWKGIGVGFTYGLRDADFEFDGTQSYYSVGLTYNL